VSITDWPEGERPREKLLARGAPALSDAELLAIFLRTGVRGKSAVDLGREMVDRFGSLNALFAAGDGELASTSGVGTAKCAQLRAAYELARRALEETAEAGDALASPEAVRRYLQFSLAHRPHEIFVAVWLDAQHRVLKMQELFAGTLTQTSVYPREVVKDALRHNAAAVIFAQSRDSPH
jgi:DNA repair protein RadC